MWATADTVSSVCARRHFGMFANAHKPHLKRHRTPPHGLNLRERTLGRPTVPQHMRPLPRRNPTPQTERLPAVQRIRQTQILHRALCTQLPSRGILAPVPLVGVEKHVRRILARHHTTLVLNGTIKFCPRSHDSFFSIEANAIRNCSSLNVYSPRRVAKSCCLLPA